MSTKPRNPRYFPRMKVRGKRRRHLAPFQRATGAIERVGIAAAFTLEQFKTLAETAARNEATQ